MRVKKVELLERAGLLAVRSALSLALACRGKKPRLYARPQPDGWTVQPIAVPCRFLPGADLDPATGIPVGDEGYYLYILNESANWDYSQAPLLLFSIWQRPWAHSWLILESPQGVEEFGHTGDFGVNRLRYHDGVFQEIKEGAPNPIAYLWQTMLDGQFQVGKPNRPPNFVWRVPITSQRHQLIQEYILGRTYDQFGLRSNNCTDMVVETARLTGINLMHRIRLTLPSETKVWGGMRRVWSDPQYRILEYGTPDVLDVELRHLARLGIGSDATDWYLSGKRRHTAVKYREGKDATE